MAEKITIAELDINTDAFIAAATATKREIVALKEAQKELKKEGREGSQAFVENEAKLKNLGSTYTSQKNVLAALTDESNRFIQVQDQINDSVDREIVSIQSARENNKELLKIRNELNLSTEEGQRELGRINGKLDENNNFIKENVSQYEQQKINIGNYTDSIREAIGGTNLFGREFVTVTNYFGAFSPVMGAFKTDMRAAVSTITNATAGTEAMSAAQRRAAVTTRVLNGALKLLKLALIGTGIGAILVAFGSLVAFLSSTQRGIDEVTKVTKPLQVIFQKMVGVVQEFGEKIFDAFSNPKQLINDLGNLIKDNLITRFEALKRIIERVINLDFSGIGEDISQAATGVVDLSGKLSDMGNNAKTFLTDAVATGNQLRQIAIDIEQKEADLVLTRAQLTNEIKKQELIAKDTQKSAEARNAAVERAIELSNQLSGAEQDILKLKIQQEEIEQTLNDSGRADLEALNTLKAELISKEEEAQSREMRFLGARNSAIKQQQAEAAAAAEEQKRIAEEAEEAAIEEARRRIESFSLELEIYKETNREKLESDKELTEAFIETAIATQLQIKEQRLEILRQELEEGFVTQREADLQKLVIEREYQEYKQELEDEFFELSEEKRIEREEVKKERELLEAEAEIELRKIKSDNDYAFRLSELDRKYQAEIAAAEKIQADTTAITARHEEDRKKLMLASTLFQMQQYSTILGGFVDLVGEQSDLGKAAAFVQAGINVAQGVTKALADGGVAGILTGALVAANGAVQMSKIAGFYEGGVINDGVEIPNHMRNSGGDDVLIQAKRGEVILNKEQQQRAGGAAFFNSIGVPSFNTGGYVGGNTSNIISNAQSFAFDYSKFAQETANAVSQLPNPVVGVEEITEGIENRNNVVSLGNI